MNGSSFRGTGVATITPFKDGKVDFDTLARIIDYQIDQGVDYLVCLGTTGEAITLSHDETRAVLKKTIEVNKSRVPLVFGIFGGNNTAYLAEKLKNYDLDGVDAVLSSSPAYNKPTQEGIFRHYQTLAEHSPRPIILYNVPGRTSSAIDVNTTLRLAHEVPNVIGIKDASGDMVQATRLVKQKPEDFLILSGDDPTTLPFLACGGDGVISVIANAFPALFSDMVRHALNGDFTAARKNHLTLIDVHPPLYKEGNPAGIKGAMEILGYGKRTVRLPLVDLTDATYLQLKEAMDQVLS